MKTHFNNKFSEVLTNFELLTLHNNNMTDVQYRSSQSYLWKAGIRSLSWQRNNSLKTLESRVTYKNDQLDGKIILFPVQNKNEKWNWIIFFLCSNYLPIKIVNLLNYTKVFFFSFYPQCTFHCFWYDRYNEKYWIEI
jgi:hypothetical protein